MQRLSKVWDDADNQDGKRPQDLTVTLMKNETVVVQTVTLDAVHNWTAKVENLAKNENGTPIRYSWVEGIHAGGLQPGEHSCHRREKQR